MSELTGQDLIRYLKIYNADIDWQPHLAQMSKQINGRIKNADDAKEMRWKQAACTILLPLYDPMAISDPPENLLFRCFKYHQFDTRDWVGELEKIHKRNQIIEETRTKALDMGVVYPIEYNPNTRQAFRWLREHSQSAGDWIEDETSKKMKTLVFAYGGAVICSVFLKPELKTKIHKLLNWRTGYFFEQLIFDVYNPDEILKIKNQELNRIKNSDPKLIKVVRISDNLESQNDQII